MEYKIIDQKKSLKEIMVEVEPSKISDYLKEAAEKISLNTNIKGFRPGKAPLNVIKEFVGEEKIWQEACYQAVNKSYFEIIDKEKIETISNPEIEIIEMKNNEKLVYRAVVTVMPEISLPDYKKDVKKILDKKKSIDVTEKEIDFTVDNIKKSRATKNKVSREAKKGDSVVITFQGEIDGIKQEEIKGENVEILLGEKTFIKGFEEEIIGMKEGESKIFKSELPFSEKENKEVTFYLDVVSVNEVSFPEINDDWAKTLGDFSNLKELKEKIKENIAFEKENKAKEARRIEMMEKIQENVSAEIPEVFIDRELDSMIKEFKLKFLQSGKSYENYLKDIDKTEEDLKKDWRKEAEKRIKTSLILQKIAETEKIEANKEKVEEELNNYLNRIHDEKMKNEIDIDRLRSYIEDVLKNNETFEFLESL